MSKDSEMISLDEAEAIALEALAQQRKEILEIVQREMQLLSKDLARTAKNEFESTIRIIEGEHAELRSAFWKRTGADISDHVLWGICLTGLGGLVLGMLIAGFMGLFEFSPC